MDSKLKIGDSVILLDNRYPLTPSNPKFSKTKIIGVVVGVRNRFLQQSYFKIHVFWDNGYCNVYNVDDLAKYKKSHPLTKIFK